MLTITCIDSVPLAPETLRKICAGLLIHEQMNLEEKVATLMPIFSPHFATLKGMSRNHRDWILDNLIHHWVGPLFSIPDAIRTLSADFEAHGVSPHFVTDWRWYKDIWGDQSKYNEIFRAAYHANVHSFLDYRFTHPVAADPDENDKLIECCDKLFQLHYQLRMPGYDKRALAKEAVEIVDELYALVNRFSVETGQGILDCKKALRHYVQHGQLGDFGTFADLWGRGQQYISFLRKASY